jgi:hypothetical protein
VRAIHAFAVAAILVSSTSVHAQTSQPAERWLSFANDRRATAALHERDADAWKAARESYLREFREKEAALAELNEAADTKRADTQVAEGWLDLANDLFGMASDALGSPAEKIQSGIDQIEHFKEITTSVDAQIAAHQAKTLDAPKRARLLREIERLKKDIDYCTRRENAERTSAEYWSRSADQWNRMAAESLSASATGASGTTSSTAAAAAGASPRNGGDPPRTAGESRAERGGGGPSRSEGAQSAGMVGGGRKDGPSDSGKRGGEGNGGRRDGPSDNGKRGGPAIPRG